MSADPRVRQFVPQPGALATRARQLDPYPWYREHRATDPVRYDSERDVWDVLRYDDATAVLTDHERLSSDIDAALDLDVPEDQRPPIADTMLRSDPPRHTRQRDVVDEYFQPGAVRRLAPRIEAIADDLLDDVTGDRMEVIGDLAYPLPVIVIAELLGVPSEDRAQFRRWSNDLIVDVDGDAIEAQLKARQQTFEELAAYFEDVIDARRTNPQDDLISEIVHSTADGALSDREMLGFCELLLVAGNITTTNLIGNAVRCIAENDVDFAVFAGDRQRRDRAIEEVLRYRSPVQAVARVTTAPVTLGTESIDAGEMVIAWLGSANRDPAVFDAPEQFRPERHPNNHIAFGKGVHFCLGAHLARLEARVALGRLATRLEGIEPVATDLEPVESTFIHGVTSFPITFDRIQPA